MEYFLRYGWEAGKESSVTENAARFTEHWINSNFSGKHGAEVIELYETFAQVTNVRKIEHMNSNVFSQTAYGDEAGRRLLRLEELFRKGNELLYKLPIHERAAFFQLVLMKIHASYYTNHEFYYADRSVLAYERGNMQAADQYVAWSLRMMDYKLTMLHYYNKKMSDGKWDRMLTPESFPPPPTAMYPARKPALRIEGSSMRVDLWNEEQTLHFSVYGRRQKWIELGNQGEGVIPFSIEIETGADWIVLSETEGILQTEQRILVTVADPRQHAGKHGRIVVHDHKNGTSLPITVQVEQPLSVPVDFSGYIEADGVVSMPAASYQRNYDLQASPEQSDKNGWVLVPGLGRYEGAALMAWIANPGTLDEPLKERPYCAYDFYIKESGEFVLEIYRVLTLHATGRIRFGLGIDDGEPITIETETRDEWLGNWQEAVLNNGEKLQVNLPYLTAGVHTLKLYMIDPYVTISKLVIYTSEKKETNLGPITSWHQNAPVVEYGKESPEVDWLELESLCKDFYATTTEEVPLPKVLYATKEFYETRDQIFKPCLGLSQEKLGKKRYEHLGIDGESKDILQEFGKGVWMEKNGVIAIEAEYALENSEYAFLTHSKDEYNLTWSHLQAETDGRTGFAMHVAEPGILWDDPDKAPGMHYRIRIQTPGMYHVWMLLRHYNDQSDSCYLAVNGKVQPLHEQYGHGNLHTYNTAQVYYWCLISDLELSLGEQVLSILARKSQLRVDRIYLTQGDELPPIDADWNYSQRK